MPDWGVISGCCVSQQQARVGRRLGGGWGGKQREWNRRLLLSGAGFPGSVNLLSLTTTGDRVSSPWSQQPPHPSARAVALQLLLTHSFSKYCTLTTSRHCPRCWAGGVDNMDTGRCPHVTYRLGGGAQRAYNALC